MLLWCRSGKTPCSSRNRRTKALICVKLEKVDARLVVIVGYLSQK